MTTLTEYLEIAADNCVSSGDVDIAVLMRQAASTISRQQSELAESREREGRLEQMNKWHRDAARTVVAAFDLLPPEHAARFSLLNINTLREVLAAEKEEEE
ncbi:MAG: hypothetical protein ABFE07_22625 [Armatimonadia bacterium]